jgi:protein-tyrosine phosphatase
MVLRFGDQTVRLISGAPFSRLSRVTPQLYVGGQHYKRGWRRMQRQGITAIVNMREAHHRHANPPERYLHLPTNDNTPPSLDDLRQGAAFIAEEIARGGCVYIHCGVGVGRAPTMAAAYLITTGMSAQDAISAIQKVRPFIHPTPTQRAQLERFAAEFRQNGQKPNNS